MSIFDRTAPEYSPEEIADRAFRAARLLEDDLFLEAVREAEWGILQRLKQGPLEDTAAQLYGVDQVIANLRAMVDELQVQNHKR